MGKLAKSGWQCFIKLGKKGSERYKGILKVINIENGDYDFFIYGPVKKFLYVESKKYSKEIIDLLDEDISIKHSFRNYFLKGKKGIIPIPRRSRLRFHFKTLISFNEEERKIWVESLGKNDQEILESLKKNIKKTDSVRKEYIDFCMDQNPCLYCPCPTYRLSTD